VYLLEVAGDTLRLAMSYDGKPLRVIDPNSNNQWVVAARRVK
jgi:hypothetical protein